jgi:SAM-dependent methyltransferase
MNCPLCMNPNTALEGAIEVHRIVSRWKQDFGIDVQSEFGGVSLIEDYKCHECAVRFFKPDSAAGSPALYEVLEKLAWYYMPQKWEHDAALQDMNGASNGIEIGCGFGAFVARVKREKEIPFEGCEQNPSAVRVGQSRGIPVRLENLGHLAQCCPAAYDVVCAFQVLEHVTDPRGFLKDACSLLRPGGKLILGLPNAKSFLKHVFNVFELPPHHMTCWSNAVLDRLQALFPVRLVRIAYEPLQDYQVEWYVEAYEGILRRWGVGRLVHPWIRSRTVWLLRRSRIRRLLKGETIYACYVRRG